MEKINEALEKIAEIAPHLNGDFYVIGSAAIYLTGYHGQNVNDIDIFTSTQNVEIIKNIWEKYFIDFEPEKESLFRSNFAQFSINGFIIEVMGGLEIKKNGVWEKLVIEDYFEIPVNNQRIKIPTVKEQIRILKLFGRPKDLEKLTNFSQ